MKGSEEGFRGPPYVYKAYGQRPSHRGSSPMVAHALINSSSINDINDTRNYQQDYVSGSYTPSTRVSAAYGSESSSTRGSNQLYHHRSSTSGPPRDHVSDDHRHWVDNATSTPSSRGSEEGLRGLPYVYKVHGWRPSHRGSSPMVAPAHINSSSINAINNTRNYVSASYTPSTRVFASHGSESSSTRSSNQHYHHRSSTSGPPRDHGVSDDNRHWVDNATSTPSSREKFVLVSYNILGVDNANQQWRELYWHIPAFIMEWNYRKKRILQELQLWSPDIICLQEVDRFEDLQNGLVQQGYEGIYKGRTGGSTDGCATFWRTQKFNLLQEESIEYQEFDLRHNVAQLCVLQTRGGKQRGKGKIAKEMDVDNRVLVCNIHVLFNPNRGEIKLGQVRHLLEKAYSLSQEWGGIPVVVAGDFNTIPQSPLYQFILDAVLDVSRHNRRAISGQLEMPQRMRRYRVERWTATSEMQINNEGRPVRAESSIASAGCSVDKDKNLNACEWTSVELETATGSARDSLMKHNLKLESAYSSIQGSSVTRDSNNEPLVTTYHAKFMGTVDYIWFTEGLVSVKVLDVLPVHILQRTKGLPSKKWGSDHLALACEFAFSQRCASQGDDVKKVGLLEV